jgi:hypothetical protein
MNQSALDHAIQLHPDLWQIKNLLCQDELEELISRVSVETQWQKLDLQENLNRETVPWNTDGVLDWLWCRLNNLDFSKFGLTFRTVVLWRDTEGYTISGHVDNERVTAAMQIYLSPTTIDLGTWFLDEIEIPFVQNTGYLMHNRNRIHHGMKNTVPAGYTRLSFYALFDQKS